MSEIKNKRRVGVLRGGMGPHYENSLQRGGELIARIQENLSDTWKVYDIFIDKDGIWHLGGLPIMPVEISNKVDIVWNMAHQSFSGILARLAVPVIDNHSFLGNVNESREMLESHMREINIKMPRHILLPVYQSDFDGEKEAYVVKKAQEVFEKFGAPWIIKSFSPNKNMGIHLAKTYPELIDAIWDGVNQGNSILVEEFISGKVTSTHSVSGFRNQDLYTFPPENLNQNEKDLLLKEVGKIFNHLGAKNYLQANFVVSPRGIYLTHINFHPDLKDNSHLMESCEKVGAKIDHVLEHMLERAFL